MDGLNCFLDYLKIKFTAEPGQVRYRQKIIGQHHFAAVGAPAHQAFQAYRLARGEINNRLQIGGDFVASDSAA